MSRKKLDPRYVEFWDDPAGWRGVADPAQADTNSDGDCPVQTQDRWMPPQQGSTSHQHRRHSWENPDAHGQLLVGQCLSVAVQEVKELESPVNLMDYYGMYDPDCGCEGCTDRRWKAC